MNKFLKKMTGVFLAASLAVGTLGTVTAHAEVAWPKGPSIEASSAIVVDAASGTVLYEKNADDKHYPASITKVLTTLVALENSDPEDTVTFSTASIDNTYGSGIARDYGEQMSVLDTLYAVMLESANECAYAIAEHVGDGDYSAFIKMMNDKAAALGCTGSNFANCNGLPQDDHWTTCRDMALIARAAIQNETFRTICGTTHYEIQPTNKHSEITPLNNHHMMFSKYKGSKFIYENAIGGKTGWTEEAHYTLVTFAEKNGMTLVCVLMDAPTQDAQYNDTKTLFEYCFNNFKMYNVSENEIRYEDQGAKTEDSIFEQGDAFAQVDKDAEVILPTSANFSDTTTEVIYDNVGGNILGTLVYTYGDRVVGEANVITTGVKVDGYEFGKKTGILNTDTNLLNPDGTKMTIWDQIKDKFTDDNGKFTLSKLDLQSAVFLLLCAAILIILFVLMGMGISRLRRIAHRKNPYEKQYKKIRKNKKWNKRYK